MSEKEMPQTIDIDYVYRMISKIYTTSIYWMFGLILIGIAIDFPMYWKMESHIRDQLIFTFGTVIFSIVIVLVVFRVLKKSSITNERKLFIGAIILIVQFSFGAIVAFPVNPLMWGFLIVATLVSVFIFEITHWVALQSICYIAFLILLTSESFSTYIAPKRVGIILIMIISSIVSYVGRTIVKQLIDKLLAESKKLRSTNEELYELNEELEDRVQARTIDLEVAMEELRAAIEDLQNAQDRLMKTKSMESFLELARGLSHLINTPLGVSVTSVSYINNLIRDIKTSTEEKSISQKKLLENIAEVQGAINIISSNIDRSISVVAMLKRFSLYEPMREINLSDSLYVLQSEMKLDEFFKKANYDIRVDSEIQMKLPELTFHKIIRTIVENSIFFGQVEPLNVSIVIKEEPKHIRVELSDNGVGVSEEMREKIFEPFFSSNPHKLGMGLFIAESISHHMLNGRLYLDNEYRDGAKIVIMLPKEIDLLED